jgi:hypothetical protein
VSVQPIPYDATRNALFHPGTATDFFAQGRPETDTALCAEMARLAYVKDLTDLKSYLARAGFELNGVLGYTRRGTQAFVARDRASTVTVVAFRGTEPDDPSDLFADAKFALADWHDAAGNLLGKVHHGFADAAREKERVDGRDIEIFPQLKRLIDANIPAQRILLTGHSLGAALATLMASWVPAAHLYTIGSPRVGNAAFAQSLKNPLSVRCVNCCDLVTRIPPESGLGFEYRDAGTLEYIDRHGKKLGSASESTINQDRLAGAASYFLQYAFLRGTVFARELADHAPINYVSGVTGARTSG